MMSNQNVPEPLLQQNPLLDRSSACAVSATKGLGLQDKCISGEVVVHVHFRLLLLSYCKKQFMILLFCAKDPISHSWVHRDGLT